MSELSDLWTGHLIGSVLEGAMIGRRGFDHYGFAGRGYGLILFSDAGIEFTGVDDGKGPGVPLTEGRSSNLEH